MSQSADHNAALAGNQGTADVSLDVPRQSLEFGHLVAFILPASALAYLLTGPHHWPLALFFFAIPILLGLFDSYSLPDTRTPKGDGQNKLFFELVLYGLAAFQLLNIALLPRMLRTVPLFSFETPLAILLVGGASAYCGIVVAHELIHRRSRREGWLARLLLITTLFDHLHIEHIAIHHALVGTLADPTTARYGEKFWAYLWRTTKGQIQGAWQVECKRLRAQGVSAPVSLLLRNGVLHGVAFYFLIFLYMWYAGGPTATFVFFGQAVDSIILLQSVNYFEHYGLRRTGKKVQHLDSWDSDSWFSRHALIGLSRHADHHVNGARPYQNLELSELSPKLPYGYMGMAFLTVYRNAVCRRILDAELQNRGLGPFAAMAARESGGL